MIASIPFIQKDHPDLPDSYGVNIFFMDGKNEEIEVVSHKVYTDSPLPFLECIKKDDLFVQIPMTAIKKLEFDKRFSKFVELKKKLKKPIENKNEDPVERFDEKTA